MIVVCISGASGPILGIRLIEELLNLNESITGILSASAKPIIAHETGHEAETSDDFIRLINKRKIAENTDRLRMIDNKDFFSPLASGSVFFEAVVVIPCSMKTLSAVAHGYGDTLINRCCDIGFKEKRRVVMVPRETPLNLIHIENMRKAVLAGADMVPPVPGFYADPKTVDDVINFVIGKILNLLGRKHTLFKSWEDLLKIKSS